MSEVAALPDTPNEDLSPFLDGDAKDEMIQGQHGFLITEARPHVASTNPQFKDQVMYEIAFLAEGAVEYLTKQGRGKDGKIMAGDDSLVAATAPGWASNSKRWMLALQHNSRRQKQAELVLEKLALGAPMVGPCWLVEKASDTPGFSPTRLIVGVPRPPLKKSAKSNGAATPQTTPEEADGIPFLHFDSFTVS